MNKWIPFNAGSQVWSAVSDPQRSGVTLATAARREGVEVLTEPSAYVAVVHEHGR